MIRIETDRQGLLITVFSIGAFLLFGMLFLLGMSQAENARLVYERNDLAREIEANSAEISVLNDRMINLQEWATITGIGSWYGTDGEQGHVTANGEIFDRLKFTIAVPWPLPMDRFYTVTRSDTWQSIRAWANDRIPRKWGRIVDLSEAAARELGMIERGVVRVRLEPGA